MKLEEAVEKLQQLDEEGIICVRRPWSPTAECIVATPTENLGVPASVKAAGVEYFLEVDLAKEVLEVFGTRQPSVGDRIRLLIYYAENDAYPDWVYET